MNPDTVLAKTALGAEALGNRDHELPRTLRHTLILVDGHSSLAELQAKGSIIPEFAAALRELVERGLVAPRGEAILQAPPASSAPPAGAPSPSLRDALSKLAAKLLGAKADKVVRKLAEAGDSRDELTVAAESCYKLIRLTIDESLAEEFRRSAKSLLG